MDVEYADKQPVGYRSCILFMLFILGVAALIARGIFLPWPDRVVTIVISIVFGATVASLLCVAGWVALVLHSLPSMRYELRDDALYLILGPWKSRIPYNSISDVVRKDLALSVLSSFRMPGVAVFDVMYSDEGMVRMYSMHALKDITLIKTVDGKKYGLSPADPDGFLRALQQHMSQKVTTSGTNSVSAASSPAPRHPTWPVWLSLSLSLATLITTLVMFARLPATLTIHWDLLGMPNGFLPRFWGAFLIPFLSLLFAIVPLVIPDSSGMARKTWYTLIVAVLGILFLCQLFLLLWNTGVGTANSKFFVPLLIILIAGSIVMQLVYIPHVSKQSKHPLST